MEFFDSHSHYNDNQYENQAENIIKRVYNQGITNIIVAGYNLETSKKAIELSEKFDFIYATCGISPNDLNANVNEQIKEIKQISQNKKVVAIGEIGLDYHWTTENKEIQKEIFIKQIEIANELNLPIVIHSRDASIDTIEIIKKISCNNKGVFHCCQLNMELIKSVLKEEYFVSFAGPITYKNTKNVEEIIKNTPIEKILIETDCPYLSPEPLRGTQNDSGNLKYIAQKIADIKQMELQEISDTTIANTRRIFKI